MPGGLSVDEENIELRRREEIYKAKVPKLMEELRGKIPEAKRSPVIERALQFNQKRLGECGQFCMGEDSEEENFFLNPYDTCPPPGTLKEMKLEACPIKLM